MRLDVVASDHGVSPAGLGDRALAVGAYAGVPLRDLLAEASSTETPDDSLRRAIRTASHGFDDCENTGALVSVEELPVCGEERSVSGPAGGACHALDDECGRGFFDQDQACCALRPRAAGVRCAEGAGRCDGNGACVPQEDAGDLTLPEAVDGLDQRACTTAHGCILDLCSTATNVMDSNGVIGCSEVQSDSHCPVPGANDCRLRPTGACQSDGSCILLPNDSKCASRLSAANECLVATCQADGSCGITENTNLCDFGCTPRETPSEPTCERHTSGSREYGLCRSLGCIPLG